MSEMYWFCIRNNNFTPTVADMRLFLNQLCARLITFPFKVRELFSNNRAISHFHAAHHIDELNGGTVSGYKILTNN